MRPYKNVALLPVLSVLLLIGCSTARNTASPAQNATTRADTVAGFNHQQLSRAVPNSIASEIPDAYYNAIDKGTRTISGEPGPNYWQQQSDYDIQATITPSAHTLRARGTIQYANNSPDTLQTIYLELAQNLHKKGSPRKAEAEITGGITIEHLSLNGQQLSQHEQQQAASYRVDGTVMAITPPEPILPGQQTDIELRWSFLIPQKGADGRMGYSQDNLLFLAYWYPKVRLYDDVNGWFTDPFLGNAEFYNEFGNYNITVRVPPQWVVMGTGTLQNARTILQPAIFKRMQQAYKSDSVTTVVGEHDFGNITRSTADSLISWQFSATDVTDFAFSVTRESTWDATRTPVGDLDADGQPNYARINALYRERAPLWSESARYAAHSIAFLSQYTGLSYPWPHMTTVEGAGIIGGGMEFPMMTIIGDYNSRGANDLYAVTAHELAHMWVPMQLATNERRYAWMDEGTTTFNENQAKKHFFSDAPNPDITDFGGYTRIAGTSQEGPIMRWSDFQYSSSAYGVASYPKPASILVALRGLLGDDVFNDAYQTYMQRWQFKHPYPWDMFNTFEDISGRNLDWFWRSWYYETWTLDQSIAEVNQPAQNTTILVQDLGQVPMPAEVTITYADGSTDVRTIPVETWLNGATSAIISLKNSQPVTSVMIDAEHKFPDVNRQNNRWKVTQ